VAGSAYAPVLTLSPIASAVRSAMLAWDPTERCDRRAASGTLSLATSGVALACLSPTASPAILRLLASSLIDFSRFLVIFTTCLAYQHQETGVGCAHGNQVTNFENKVDTAVRLTICDYFKGDYPAIMQGENTFRCHRTYIISVIYSRQEVYNASN